MSYKKPPELISIVNKYFSEEQNTVNVFEGDTISKASLKYVARFNSAMTGFECPDIYAKIENEVLIIEHFEFDSGASDRKGSVAKKEEARISRNADKLLATPRQGVMQYNDAISFKPSFDNYKKNVCKHFDSHIEKIPTYIKNLEGKSVIDKNTRIKLCFFIEDTTPLGNYLNIDGRLIYLNLLRTTFFLDKIEQTFGKLDYLFFGFSTNSKNHVWFLDVEYIRDNRKKIIEIGGNDFFAFEPKVIASIVKVEKKDFVGETDEGLE